MTTPDDRSQSIAHHVAVLMYHDTFTFLPTADSLPDSPAQVTWFGEVNYETGAFDSSKGLILPYMTFALPLSIYTLSAFFREIPWELEQAAQVDGATPFQAFIRVIAPLATVALTAMGRACQSFA